ncbi:MAG: hypothetical protein JXA28_03545 [Bacteroidetes bacterium]|nr:hypothetical protein [Bacteroidota bacterium]
MPHSDQYNGVLITGATGGIGRALPVLSADHVARCVIRSFRHGGFERTIPRFCSAPVRLVAAFPLLYTMLRPLLRSIGAVGRRRYHSASSPVGQTQDIAHEIARRDPHETLQT